MTLTEEIMAIPVPAYGGYRWDVRYRDGEPCQAFVAPRNGRLYCDGQIILLANNTWRATRYDSGGMTYATGEGATPTEAWNAALASRP